PRYAPELNPVETMWSQVKTRIANRAFRSVEEVERALRSALFSGDGCPTRARAGRPGAHGPGR
ncbi:transposase, partial [Nocardiopsis rhodophaea]|uniref:transposase n=1 Tax=Nocardiopsis rhodophaea TaxID=280238 RepID=UPI0031E04177